MARTSPIRSKAWSWSTHDARPRRDHRAGPLRGFPLGPVHTEGYPRHEWILLDYGGFVVHVMKPRSRAYYDLERLLALVEVEVVDRPGHAQAQPVPPFPGARGARRVGGPGLPLSASAIREHARAGRSVRFLVPDAVLDYIGERGLYR